MQQSIEIISQYPDLGQCVLHWQQVTNVCSEKDCINQRQGFYCKKCQPFHTGHQTQSSTQFVKDLANKIVSFQPSQKKNKQNLRNTFEKIRKLTQQFQKSIKQINKIMGQIDTKKILVYEQALRCTSDQMYDKLCEWQLSENATALIEVTRTLPRMKFNHPGAPSSYENHLKEIGKRIQSFSLKVQQLMEQSFDISKALSFEQAIRQIENYVPPKVIKQQPKAPSVVQKPKSQIINLKGKDMFGVQIIQKINDNYSPNLKQINLEGNNLDSDCIRQIFQSEILKFPKLEKLIISNCLLTDECLQILLQSENIPSLTYINICDNQFESFSSQVVDRIKAKWLGITLLC